MSVLSPAELSDAQWTYLVAALKSEAGLGSPPSGTTSGNRLTGIQYVGAGYHLWTESNPSIGVQLKECREYNGDAFGLRSATSRHVFVSTFDIIIGVQSTDATASSRFGANIKANAEDAMFLLRPYISGPSGSPGSGISAVLRDPQYRLLGSTNGQNNCARSQITGIDYEWEIGPGENAQMWAYGLITLQAGALVQIG